MGSTRRHAAVALALGLSLSLTSPALAAGNANAARIRVSSAEEKVDGPRRGEVEDILKDAEKWLDGLPAAERAPYDARIKTVREKLASLITPEDERKVRAARGKIRQAQSQIDAKQTSGIEDTFKTAEKYLDGVPDKFRTPVMAELQVVKDKFAAGKPADPTKPDTTKTTATSGTGTTGTGTTGTTTVKPDVTKTTSGTGAGPTATPGVTATGLDKEAAANLGRANDRLALARKKIADEDFKDVSFDTNAAERFARELPPAVKEAIAKECAALNEMSRTLADAKENRRRVTSEIERHLRSAESFRQSSDARMSADSINRATLRLADPEARKWLTGSQVQQYETELATVKTKLAADNKSEVLSRASALVDKLEEQLKEDPFKGKEQRAAYEAASSMESVQKGIASWLKGLPADDADRKKLEARVDAARAKIATADAAWGKAQVDAEVGSGWEYIQKDIAGWEAETVDPKAQPLDFPRLAKTESAIRRIRFWLDDKRTKEIREANKGDAVLTKTYTDAEATLTQAAAKLSMAYNAVLDAAEKMPTPMRRFETDRPSQLAYAADEAFRGTKHHATDVARAKKLDDRWKAELAAIMKARQELYDKLAKEADINWPGIAARTGAKDGIDPKTAQPGQVVQLKAVYNRSGWDFGRDFDFIVRINGVPVAGNYDPHVLKALEHAWYELKLDVNDRITWDVVGVVEGNAKVGQRVTVTLRDKDTRLEIGKIEEYRPEDCVKIRITALHAGPVAVGPVK
ncbi:MAG TPA: hypothetical protein VEA69_03970 [Tepidisphaeraceae bacterium]|nr:hypothetical protein [Tepidisphaeraceae bacterium]